MGYRILGAFFAVCLAAAGQTLTVEKLVAFVESSQKIIAEGKMTDREVAGYLARVKLTERLDDRVIEDLQGAGKIGPKTLQALQALRDRTQTLAGAKMVLPEPKPAPIPPPSSEEQAAIIDHVRRYALDYSKNLPDFICTQVTRRYAAPLPGTRYGGSPGSQPSWMALDTLQIRLSYFEQKEEYKLILVNNSVTNQDYKTLGGATASGDFGSMMREIFEPNTEAHFEWDHWATLRGRRTMAFSYHVAQSRSQWHITYDRRMDIVPAYHGLVYVDRETREVTRVTLEAENIPASFPVRRADTVLDYDYSDISGHNFLLPLKAEVIMSADDYMTRNDTEFRLYRKYSTSSDIKFDTDEIPPLPDDKTKETKDPKATKK
ncbi:MAG TPA: hypothetical protein VE959_12400 [Bryobacteraceae bacterium]|nr:hypothetical protein [Bryobacteraceae bacterium]